MCYLMRSIESYTNNYSLTSIGVGCTWHTWARAQVKFLTVVDFFNRFNSVARFSNKVNKISNMTL